MTVVPITFKYLAISPLGGRGGVQRFFMLSNGVPFVEELFPPGPKWTEEKIRILETNENPCATLPVTIIKNEEGQDMHISQHIAACRYIARINNLDTGDPYKDYVQDLVADVYQSWRGEWAKHAFSHSEEEKAAYKTDGVVKQLTKFDALYKKYATAAPYLSVNKAGKPLWGDSAIFGLLYDHIQTGFLTAEEVSGYPNISELYKSYGGIPQVAAWIDEHKK